MGHTKKTFKKTVSTEKLQKHFGTKKAAYKMLVNLTLSFTNKFAATKLPRIPPLLHLLCISCQKQSIER